VFSTIVAVYGINQIRTLIWIVAAIEIINEIRTNNLDCCSCWRH